MAKLTRMMKVSMYKAWVGRGRPDKTTYAADAGIKESLMDRIIREGDAVALRE